NAVLKYVLIGSTITGSLNTGAAFNPSTMVAAFANATAAPVGYDQVAITFAYPRKFISMILNSLILMTITPQPPIQPIAPYPKGNPATGARNGIGITDNA